VLLYSPTMLACGDTLLARAHRDDPSIRHRCLALRWYTAATAGVGASAASALMRGGYVCATWVRAGLLGTTVGGSDVATHPILVDAAMRDGQMTSSLALNYAGTHLPLCYIHLSCSVYYTVNLANNIRSDLKAHFERCF